MDPKIYSIHYLLLELNNIEQMFITRVNVVMKEFQIGNSNISYKGNVLNVEKEIQPVINRLPLIPSEIPMVKYRKSNPNSPSGNKYFNVSRDKILSWLAWLKNNNRYCKDINIDYHTLNILPRNGSMCRGL